MSCKRVTYRSCGSDKNTDDLDPDVSIGGPHFMYVVFPAIDNTKYVDVVVKFEYLITIEIILKSFFMPCHLHGIQGFLFRISQNGLNPYPCRKRLCPGTTLTCLVCRFLVDIPGTKPLPLQPSDIDFWWLFFHCHFTPDRNNANALYIEDYITDLDRQP